MKGFLRGARGIVLVALVWPALAACELDFGGWGEPETCVPGDEQTITDWWDGSPIRQRCGADGRWQSAGGYSGGDSWDSGTRGGTSSGGTPGGALPRSEAGATTSCCSLRVVGPSSVQYASIGGRAGTYEARVRMQPGAAPDGGEPEPAVVFGEAERSDASALEGWVAYCLPGKLRVDVSTVDGMQSVEGDVSCDDGRFHHVVVTFDLVTSLYFDGVRVGEGAFVPAVKARTLHLGGFPSWPTTSVTTLDEIAVWDGTGPLRLRSRWFFGECSGTKAHGHNVYGGSVSLDVDASMWSATCRP